MLKEFKNFIMTGNVIDFAVAVIMAGAIGLVINGFVNDIIMPVIGHFAGGLNFADMVKELDPAVLNADGSVATPANVISYGNKTKKPVVEEAAGPSELDLLTEIRDALKK